MIIMLRVYRLSLLCFLISFILLARGFDRVNAGGETVIRFQCGETQNMTSPNYPGNYQDNSMTHWFIEVDPGKRIIVTLNDFQTEVLDSLSIIEENYPSAEVKYSGSKPFTPYVSVGNNLEMIFTSDRSQSNKGFHLSISCLKEIDNSTIHEAYEGQEHTRIITQPVCRDTWQTNVADTICREAGFLGSYETDFTSGSENDSRSDGISYRCDRSTFRLQDCEKSTSECPVAQGSVVVTCNLLSKLGCYDLSPYHHLLERKEELGRVECVTYCKAESSTLQYAALLNGSYCSCINRIELNINQLSQDRDSCGTKNKGQSGQWATLYNVSFGFCNEPPQVNNGSWKTTSTGYMFGTSITATCNDGYELVGGEERLQCVWGTNSSSQDFEWHGSIPSCRERNAGYIAFPSTFASAEKPLNDTCNSVAYCSIPLFALVPVLILIVLALLSVLVLIVVEFVLWIKKRRTPLTLDSAAVSTE